MATPRSPSSPGRCWRDPSECVVLRSVLDSMKASARIAGSGGIMAPVRVASTVFASGRSSFARKRCHGRSLQSRCNYPASASPPAGIAGMKLQPHSPFGCWFESLKCLRPSETALALPKRDPRDCQKKPSARKPQSEAGGGLLPHSSLDGVDPPSYSCRRRAKLGLKL